MEKIYSVKEPEKVLHILFSSKDIPLQGDNLKRVEFNSPEDNLQAMACSVPKGHIVKPHKHNPIERITKITNEMIMITSGIIELTIYDIDTSILKTCILRTGDCAMIINGGHRLKVIEEASFFELKNGPYFGKINDTTIIN